MEKREKNIHTRSALFLWNIRFTWTAGSFPTTNRLIEWFSAEFDWGMSANKFSSHSWPKNSEISSRVKYFAAAQSVPQKSREFESKPNKSKPGLPTTCWTRSQEGVSGKEVAGKQSQSIVHDDECVTRKKFVKHLQAPSATCFDYSLTMMKLNGQKMLKRQILLMDLSQLIFLFRQHTLHARDKRPHTIQSHSTIDATINGMYVNRQNNQPTQRRWLWIEQ